jgi:hypothetical protein
MSEGYVAPLSYVLICFLLPILFFVLCSAFFLLVAFLSLPVVLFMLYTFHFVSVFVGSSFSFVLFLRPSGSSSSMAHSTVSAHTHACSCSYTCIIRSYSDCLDRP